ncbi:MAG: hypothetical protein M1820_006895 [Bogoriella megaspora]|nr:MAG: hypothetical protein M1820_006895 [Bogoriella megaspora]
MVIRLTTLTFLQVCKVILSVHNHDVLERDVPDLRDVATLEIPRQLVQRQCFGIVEGSAHVFESLDFFKLFAYKFLNMTSESGNIPVGKFASYLWTQTLDVLGPKDSSLSTIHGRLAEDLYHILLGQKSTALLHLSGFM